MIPVGVTVCVYEEISYPVRIKRPVTRNDNILTTNSKAPIFLYNVRQANPTIIITRKMPASNDG